MAEVVQAELRRELRRHLLPHFQPSLFAELLRRLLPAIGPVRLERRDLRGDFRLGRFEPVGLHAGEPEAVAEPDPLAVHARVGPLAPARVPEQPAGRVLGDEPLDDGDGRVGEVNDPRPLVDLGFLRRQDEPLARRVVVPGLGFQELLRPGTHLPRDSDEIPERGGGDVGQDDGAVRVGRDDDCAAGGTGLLVVAHERVRRAAGLLTPAEEPLHRLPHRADGALLPVRVEGDPLLDVQRF